MPSPEDDQEQLAVGIAFLGQFCGVLLIGIGVGLLISQVVRQIDEPIVEIMLMTVAA